MASNPSTTHLGRSLLRSGLGWLTKGNLPPRLLRGRLPNKKLTEDGVEDRL
jgi:hypothetical protein